MDWLDKVAAALALAGFAAFLGTILWFVPEPDLIIVIAIVLAMVIYDFWFHRQPGSAAEKKGRTSRGP